MSKKALFLDRDGVINVEKNYLYKIEDFEFVDGILELCHFFQDMGYIIIVVTNQAGIARGYYTEEDFIVLTDWMEKEFLDQGITITKVYHCPHHEDITGPCACRKPKPGMLNEAMKHYDIDTKGSLLIGDKERDIQAGQAAGLSFTYLFTTEEISTTATKKVNNLTDILKDFHETSG